MRLPNKEIVQTFPIKTRITVRRARPLGGPLAVGKPHFGPIWHPGFDDSLRTSDVYMSQRSIIFNNLIKISLTPMKCISYSSIIDGCIKCADGCSNYNVYLNYTNSSVSNSRFSQSSKSNRKRKIIWFNPPYSKNVKINVARKLLQLIDKHFPKSSRLHTIFNRNNIKVSIKYSYMRNINTSISNHNCQLLN